MRSHAHFSSALLLSSMIFTLVVGGGILFSGHALAVEVEDEFDDNHKDKTLWGSSYVHHNGVLTEQNGRLEYTVSEPSSDYDYRSWPLIAGKGPYNSDWGVEIDLVNRTKPSKDNQVNSFGVSVTKCGNDDDEIYVELYATQLGGAPSRKGFAAEMFTEDESSGYADTSTLSEIDPLAGSVWLEFDSNGKIFNTYYRTEGDWVPFGSFGVSGDGGGNNGNGDWAMNSADQFCIAVYGYSENMAVASGKMFGDNFEATGLTAPLKTRILKPNGGETVPAGELYTVEWEAPVGAIKFKLEYSLDNGSKWKAIDPSFVKGSSYQWRAPVPSNNMRECLVRVKAYEMGYDGSNVKTGTDVSDAPFTIEVLKLNAPNGGEAPLTSGSQYPITWTTNPNVPPVKRVQLYYRLNDGLDWIPINTKTDPSDDGSFLWTVPNVTKEKKNCKVKIVLKDSSGNTLGSDKSDGVFTIQPALQLEPFAYKAYLEWGGPLKTVFTMQKPKGWEVIIGYNICAYLGFLVRDPNDPLRQIFYFGTVRPVYLTQEQKTYEQGICSMVQPPCPYTWTDAPVVNPLTVDNFFTHWPEIAVMQNAISFMPEFPKLQGLELISVVPQAQMLPLAGAETALVRGTFTGGDPADPRAAQGQFLATVVEDPPFMGTASGYMVFGATAPVGKFKADIDKMVESLNSVTLSDVYLNWCQVQMQQQWGAVADIGQTLSEASDIIWEGWVNRTAAQDIMAYQYDDLIRGVEKAWDPVSERVYEFEAGWYDQYALNPELYNITTLEPIPDNQIKLWEGIILNGPTYVYPQ